MFRRIVSSCVLAGFVVAQWASMPHAHATGAPHDHDQTPHIHVGHSHDHGCGHSHRHDTPAIEQGDELAGSQIQGVANHDSDAVYLPASQATASGDTSQHKLHMASVILACFDT